MTVPCQETFGVVSSKIASLEDHKMKEPQFSIFASVTSRRAWKISLWLLL